MNVVKLNERLEQWPTSVFCRFLPIVVISSIFLIGIGPAHTDVSLRPTTLTQIKKFLNTSVPGSERRLVTAAVPAVGCPRDGQVGPLDTPILPKSVRVIIPEGMASSLAYYSDVEAVGSGALAPRGWDCFGTYGSGGSTLYVVPRRLGDPILDRPEKLAEGSAVIRSSMIGGTSGRFPIARISARIFPRARAFVEGVRDEGLDDPNEYIFSPWPDDRLIRLSEFAVSYVTPSNRHGLGTALRLSPGRHPIFGLAFLTDVEGHADGPFLDGLAVRLEPSDERLYAAIAVANIASQSDNEAAAGSLAAVTAFYEALGRADGFSASQRVIPGKRARGPLSANAITQFYSQLSEPLRLLSVSQLDRRTVHARYHYRTAKGMTCDGEALVTTRPTEHAWLIEHVRAMKNC
jgi:hypothetical protein